MLPKTKNTDTLIKQYRYVLSLIPLVVSLLLVAGCSYNNTSSLSNRPRSNEWRKLLRQLTRYQISGSFAYISRQQKIYARFHWQQNNHECYRLLLINQLGNTEIELKVQPEITQLINQQGKRYLSDNPDIMIKKLAGITMPLNNLSKWLLGLPEDATYFTLDSRGRLRTLNYNNLHGQNWSLIYLNYHDYKLPPLPANIELYHGDKRIKLKIDQWQLTQ